MHDMLASQTIYHIKTMIDSYKQYYGKKYSLEEATKVEEILQKEAPTGEQWRWKDREGDDVIFS